MVFRAFPASVLAAALLAASLAALSGCNSADELKAKRIERADKHFDEIGKRTIPPGVVFTLPMCIDSALKNNLSLKVDDLQVAISKERRTAAILGMLPELNVRENLTNRNNEPGSSSESLATGQQSLVPSKSSQEGESNTTVELALSTLDFGLAYFNALQADDKVFFERQQKRRSAQNMIVDVVNAYFRVASTQYAMEETEGLLKAAENVDKTLFELSKDKTLSPFRALDERKRFIAQRKRLMDYRKSYENSCIELRSLMGYLPTSEIKVDTKCLDKLNSISVSDVDVLTRMALNERPELYQIDLQHHMTILEARKAILMMFPNVRVFEDFNNSSNKYLYNQSWWEIGLRASYNLLKLPQQIEEYRAYDKEADQIDLRALVLTVGIMAQVRIAHANMMEVKERYELDEKVYQANQEYLQYARSNADVLGKVSPLEIVRLEVETTETAIDRAQSLSNYYLAYYRLLNTIGIEAIDQKDVQETVAKLEEKAHAEEEREKAAPARDIKLEYLPLAPPVVQPEGRGADSKI